MTAEEKKSWVSTAAKILFFVLAFFVVIFTVMANISGNGDTFREAVEEYMTGATGYHASVGKLNHAALFPNIMFDFEEMELRNEIEDQTPAATVEKIQVKFGFFDIMLGNGRFKTLNVEGVRAVPGVILPKTVKLDALAVEELEDGKKTVLRATGAIGQDTFMAQTDIDVFGEGKGRAYSFGGQRHFTARLGDLNFKAGMNNGEFSDLRLALKDREVLTGQITLKGDGSGSVGISGEIKLAGAGTVLNPDFTVSKSSLKGTLSSPAFHIEDIGEESLARQAIEYAGTVLGGEERPESEIELPFENMDLKIKLKDLRVGEAGLGALTVPVKIKNKALDIRLDQKFIQSDLGGHIKLDARELPAKLDVDIALNDLDYGKLQERINESAEVSGTGDLILKMKSEGRSAQALTKGLNGQAMFVGGEGKFRSGAVNIWGGGLINALLPDISPEEELGVNCAIMDFTIENGIATSNALFVDGKHITLAGEGTYDIAQDNLDISLKPKPKEIAVGSVATAIKITGPLGNPSIGPSLFDLGAKLGGLLLGAVNPAFLAFSLADIGLNDKHPCATFMQGEDGAKEQGASGGQEPQKKTEESEEADTEKERKLNE